MFESASSCIYSIKDNNTQLTLGQEKKHINVLHCSIIIKYKLYIIDCFLDQLYCHGNASGILFYPAGAQSFTVFTGTDSMFPPAHSLQQDTGRSRFPTSSLIQSIISTGLSPKKQILSLKKQGCSTGPVRP